MLGDARPRVDERVALPPDEVLRRCREALDAGLCECVGHVGRQHLTLFVPESERRFWSPWLQVEVLPDAQGAQLVGRFGPEPRVWGLFVAIWAVLVFGWIGGVMYGSVQLSLGWPPTGFAVAALSTLGLIGSCGVNIAGQRATQHQMDRARAFLSRTLAT